MEWWRDCLHSTRLAKKKVREEGTLRLRPGGPTHKTGEASQLVSAFQAFDSTQRFLPGPDSPGKGCVGLPGLNRNLTRFDFTAFLLVKTLHSVARRGGLSENTSRAGRVKRKAPQQALTKGHQYAQSVSGI